MAEPRADLLLAQLGSLVWMPLMLHLSRCCNSDSITSQDTTVLCEAHTLGC